MQNTSQYASKPIVIDTDLVWICVKKFRWNYYSSVDDVSYILAMTRTCFICS